MGKKKKKFAESTSGLHAKFDDCSSDEDRFDEEADKFDGGEAEVSLVIDWQIRPRKEIARDHGQLLRPMYKYVMDDSATKKTIQYDTDKAPASCLTRTPMCTECGIEPAVFGRERNTKLRWCARCSKRFPGAVDHSMMKRVPLDVGCDAIDDMVTRPDKNFRMERVKSGFYRVPWNGYTLQDPVTLRKLFVDRYPVCASSMADIGAIGGPGMRLYLSLLLALSGIFFLMFLIAIPSLILNMSGTHVDHKHLAKHMGKWWMIFFPLSLGNIQASEEDINSGMCLELWVESITDAMQSMLFMYMIFLLQKKKSEIIKATDESITSMGDYTVWIRADWGKAWHCGLDDKSANTFVDSLKAYLESHVLNHKHVGVQVAEVEDERDDLFTGEVGEDGEEEVEEGDGDGMMPAMWLGWDQSELIDLWRQEKVAMYELEEMVALTIREHPTSTKQDEFLKAPLAKLRKIKEMINEVKHRSAPFKVVGVFCSFETEVDQATVLNWMAEQNSENVRKHWRNCALNAPALPDGSIVRDKHSHSKIGYVDRDLRPDEPSISVKWKDRPEEQPEHTPLLNLQWNPHEPFGQAEVLEDKDIPQQERWQTFFKKELPLRSKLTVKPAPEPEVLLWEHLQYSPTSQCWRKMVVVIALLVLLALGVAVIVGGGVMTSKWSSKCAEVMDKRIPEYGNENYCDGLNSTTSANASAHVAHTQAVTQAHYRESFDILNSAMVVGFPKLEIQSELWMDVFEERCLLDKAAAHGQSCCANKSLSVLQARNQSCMRVDSKMISDGEIFDGGGRDAICYVCMCITERYLPVGQDGMGTYCSPFREQYLVSTIFSSIAAGSVIAVNQVIRAGLISLVAFERMHTKMENDASVAIKVFLAQFANTAVLLLILSYDSTLTMVLPGERHVFSNLNAEWYAIVGGPLVMTLITQFVVPPFTHVGQSAVRCILRSCKVCFCMPRTQNKLNQMYENPPFNVAAGYGEVLFGVAVTMVFSSGLPITYLVAACGFALKFFLDKWAILRAYKKPDLYGSELFDSLDELLMIALCMHTVFGTYMFAMAGVDVELSEKVELEFPDGYFKYHVIPMGLAAAINCSFTVLVFLKGFLSTCCSCCGDDDTDAAGGADSEAPTFSMAKKNGLLVNIDDDYQMDAQEEAEELEESFADKLHLYGGIYPFDGKYGDPIKRDILSAVVDEHHVEESGDGDGDGDGGSDSAAEPEPSEARP